MEGEASQAIFHSHELIKCHCAFRVLGHGKQLSRHIHLQFFFCNYNGITPITKKDQKGVSDLLRRSFMRLGGLSTSSIFFFRAHFSCDLTFVKAVLGHTTGPR